MALDKTGYGQRLLEARLSAGFSQQDVADKLRLTPALIEALEQESQPDLPAPAYVKGYIRLYAQFLGCDYDSLLGLYSRVAARDPELTHSTPVESQAPASVGGVKKVLLVAVLLLIGFTAVIGYSYFSSSRQQAEVVETDTLPPAAAPAGIPPVAVEIPAGNNGFAVSAVPDTFPSDQPDNSDADIQPQAETAATPSPELLQESALVEKAVEQEQEFDLSAMPKRRDVLPQAPYGEDTLTVNIDGPCWLEAVDANGFRLIFGLFDRADRQLSVHGQAPFQLIVGNARVVNVLVNNKPFELKRFIRSNNAARVLVRADAR